jgi:hypothetical protein
MPRSCRRSFGTLRIYTPESSASDGCATHTNAAILFSSIVLLLLPAVVFGQNLAPKEQTLRSTDAPLPCKADRSEVHHGDIVTITSEPKRNDLLYAFGSDGGTLTVAGNTAILNTSGAEGSLAVNVFCSAISQQGQILQSSVSVEFIVHYASVPNPPNVSTKLLHPGMEEQAPYKLTGLVAPTLAWTAGTQTQTISGGSMLLSSLRSRSYCDADMVELGIAASASDTGTTKVGASTVNVDNNDVKFNATKGVFGGPDAINPKKMITRSYLGVDADFMDNNSLGIGLQQTYALEYQFNFRRCTGDPWDPKDPKRKQPPRRIFASLGIGAGFMNQRLYATSNKLNASVLPLSAQFSYLSGLEPGKPPRFIWYALFGYLPVLTDLHAYQVSTTAGVQIPTRIPWLTLSLTETDLYMNNAPTKFLRNYQNGSISLSFSFPVSKTKPVDVGACYAADKLARLYCYDDVTIDSCSPPNTFRPLHHCATPGTNPALANEVD